MVRIRHADISRQTNKTKSGLIKSPYEAVLFSIIRGFCIFAILHILTQLILMFCKISTLGYTSPLKCNSDSAHPKKGGLKMSRELTDKEKQ